MFGLCNFCIPNSRSNRLYSTQVDIRDLAQGTINVSKPSGCWLSDAPVLVFRSLHVTKLNFGAAHMIPCGIREKFRCKPSLLSIFCQTHAGGSLKEGAFAGPVFANDGDDRKGEIHALAGPAP